MSAVVLSVELENSGIWRQKNDYMKWCQKPDLVVWNTLPIYITFEVGVNSNLRFNIDTE